MPFILDNNSTFKWPVVYRTPRNDGSDRFNEQQFIAEFTRLSQSRFDQLHKISVAAKLARDVGQEPEEEIDDLELLKEILVGWTGIKDKNGEDVPHNDVTRNILFDLPGMKAAIINAFFESVARAARKN